MAVRLLKKKTPLSRYTVHQVKEDEIIVTIEGKKTIVVKVTPKKRGER